MYMAVWQLFLNCLWVTKENKNQKKEKKYIYI